MSEELKYLKKVIGTATDEIADMVPKIDEYRAKEVNKYYREKELDWGPDAVKLQIYKNRVRVVDLFLPGLKRFLVSVGALPSSATDGGNERDIP